MSVLTKAFTAVLIPVWMVGMAVSLYRRRTPGEGIWRVWSPLVIWAALVAAIVGACLLVVVHPENVGQLYEVHLAARQTAAYQVSESLPGINSQLADSLPLLIMAAVGVFRACRRQVWSILYLAGWAITGYGLLLINRPAWSHQQLLITVPAAILAGVAVGMAVADVGRSWRAAPAQWSHLTAGVLTLALLTVFLVERGPTSAREFERGLPNLPQAPIGDAEQRQLLAVLLDHAKDTTWFLTDRPMFAFRANLAVPPYLAVLSQKRILTGQLTEAEMRSMLDQYSPEMILSGRFDLPVVAEYEQDRGYVLIKSSPRYQLYLLRAEP
jgi:hypothetical protein